MKKILPLQPNQTKVSDRLNSLFEKHCVSIPANSTVNEADIEQLDRLFSSLKDMAGFTNKARVLLGNSVENRLFDYLLRDNSLGKPSSVPSQANLSFKERSDLSMLLYYAHNEVMTMQSQLVNAIHEDHQNSEAYSEQYIDALLQKKLFIQTKLKSPDFDPEKENVEELNQKLDILSDTISKLSSILLFKKILEEIIRIQYKLGFGLNELELGQVGSMLSEAVLIKASSNIVDVVSDDEVFTIFFSQGGIDKYKQQFDKVALSELLQTRSTSDSVELLKRAKSEDDENTIQGYCSIYGALPRDSAEFNLELWKAEHPDYKLSDLRKLFQNRGIKLNADHIKRLDPAQRAELAKLTRDAIKKLGSNAYEIMGLMHKSRESMQSEIERQNQSVAVASPDNSASETAFQMARLSVSLSVLNHPFTLPEASILFSSLLVDKQIPEDLETLPDIIKDFALQNFRVPTRQEKAQIKDYLRFVIQNHPSLSRKIVAAKLLANYDFNFSVKGESHMPWEEFDPLDVALKSLTEAKSKFQETLKSDQSLESESSQLNLATISFLEEKLSQITVQKNVLLHQMWPVANRYYYHALLDKSGFCFPRSTMAFMSDRFVRESIKISVGGA